MPAYTEESAAWQAAVEAAVGTRPEVHVIFDPDGENVPLSAYLARVDEIGHESELKDFRYMGREFALHLNAMGTQKMNRFDPTGLLYGLGWFEKPIEIWARLHGPQGMAARKMFTGFLHVPQETRGGAVWSLVDQFARMRNKKIVNIDSISTVHVEYGDSVTPSLARLDREQVTINDVSAAHIERWEISFDLHPDADPDRTAYNAGDYYVQGDVTGMDTINGSPGNSGSNYTTESGLLTIPGAAWNETPDRGDRFVFLTTVRLTGTPPECLKNLLQNHSDLEVGYIHTASMDTADLLLRAAVIDWTIPADISLLKAVEVVSLHGLLMVFPDADGAVKVEAFAPDLGESLITVDPAVDLEKFDPNPADDLYNIIEIKFNFDWYEGRFKSTYRYPDDVGTIVDDDGNPATLGNESVDRHGVERVLTLEMPGFLPSNAGFLRFVGGWFYNKYSDGLETAWMDNLLHGLTFEAGDKFSLLSLYPQRDTAFVAYGVGKNIQEGRASTRVFRAAEYIPGNWMYCDLGTEAAAIAAGTPWKHSECDNGKVVW